jgi:hypothetical protein
LLMYSFKGSEANSWPLAVVQWYAFPMSGTG